jgi:hypothetical protein
MSGPVLLEPLLAIGHGEALVGCDGRLRPPEGFFL